jgi:hypothetical protein
VEWKTQDTAQRTRRGLGPVDRARRGVSTSLVAVAAVLASSLAVAFAADTGGKPARRPVSRALPAQRPVDPEVAGRFAALRRPRTAADRLPPEAVEFVREATRDEGGVPEMARLARDRGGVAVWLVPGDGSICTYATRRGQRGGGGSCQPVERILAGSGPGSSAGVGGTTVLIGLVPDGVAEVVLRARDGAVERTAPEGNVYVFETARVPKTVEWGANRIAVPVMP